MIDFTKTTDADIAALRAGAVIVVMVTEIRGDLAKVGTTAPDSVKIDRGEIYDAICGEAHEAAQPDQHAARNGGSKP